MACVSVSVRQVGALACCLERRALMPRTPQPHPAEEVRDHLVLLYFGLPGDFLEEGALTGGGATCPRPPGLPLAPQPAWWTLDSSPPCASSCPSQLGPASAQSSEGQGWWAASQGAWAPAALRRNCRCPVRGFRGQGGSETRRPPLPLMFSQVLHACLRRAARPAREVILGNRALN